MDSKMLFGLLSVVPATLILTVSFFVLFLLFKVEKSALRIFGLVVVGLLSLSAIIVYSSGIIMVAEGTSCFGDNGLYKAGKCCSSKMTGCNCWPKTGRYHKKMMLDPHHGMMMDLDQSMKNCPSSNMPGKYMNSTQQDTIGKYHAGSGAKK